MLMIDKPITARLVHYSDLDGLSGQFKYSVQAYCSRLVEQGITGSLWIYPNRDVLCEWLPDCIYPSIKQAAIRGNADYHQLHTNYGLRHGVLWGYLANREPEDYSTPT